MLQEQRQGEPPIRLASGPAAGAAAGEGAVTLPRLRLPSLPARIPWPRTRVGSRTGHLALAAVVMGALLVVLVAVAGPSVLVPRSTLAFPGWDAGPLGAVIPRVIRDPKAVGIGFSVVLLSMLLAYVVALRAVPVFSARTLATTVIALHLILLLSPPLQLNDVFNYIGYAHLGGLHHLNPYRYTIGQETFDPVSQFASWNNLRSPYGPLFSALTYPLAFMPLSLAYWTLKIVTVGLSLGFVTLVWQCARQLGRDPRLAVVLVALNPIYLMYAVGGFHNDFFMLVPMLGAVSLLLAGRDRSAGAVLMLAVAIKFTAALILPFLLVAAVTRPRRLRVLAGAAMAAVPLVAISLLLFGFAIPNLAQQSSLLTDFSIPNIVGVLIGAGGGTPFLLKLALVGVVVVLVHQITRSRDWLSGAGWSTVALIASLSWLMPWYVIWVLPLAALGTSIRLRRVAVAGTLFLILSFMPATNLYMKAHGINPLGGPAGRASLSQQNKLEQ
ncbi:MAG TPA: glycosyltransferase family 87 protein [Solirubrobacteraceae bacterium]